MNKRNKGRLARALRGTMGPPGLGAQSKRIGMRIYSFYSNFSMTEGWVTIRDRGAGKGTEMGTGGRHYGLTMRNLVMY